MKSAPTGTVQFYDQHPAPADFYGEVVEGLDRTPRSIPPKFFYDAAGSRLFDLICELPEYYPTRTEKGILENAAGEIAELTADRCLLVEPGSGSMDKVRLLLDPMRPHAYEPVEISREHLLQAAESIADDYPWLTVHAVCADFTKPLDLPYSPPDRGHVAFFPGSSIGNFDPDDAVRFLANLRATVGADGGLLIGVDLKKDPETLHAAYNDARGVTAAFNRNLLERINRELGGDFDPELFEHRAFYDEERGRIEMHLVSLRDQKVRVGDRSFTFAAGERIHTENSYKYGIDEFRELAGRAGFDPVRAWTDDDDLFSVHCFAAR